MLTMAQPMAARAGNNRPLALAFIGVAQILLPALFAWTVPAALQTPGNWPGAILFAAQLFALVFTSRSVARRLALTGALETTLAAIAISFCLPAAVVTYSGLVGKLSLVSALVLSGIVEIALLALTRDAEPSAESQGSEEAGSFGFFEAMLLALSVLAFAIMAFNAVRYTPADSDSMWYHLPMVAEWIKTHSIAPIASVSLMARGYPGAREAILTWLSLPMRSENVALLILVELPASFLALYAICREFAVPRALCIAVSALFFSMPEIAAWTTSQKNDLFLTIGFLFTFFFALRWVKTGLLRYAALAGLATGLLCGTKISGPAYAAAIAIPLVTSLLLARRGGQPARRVLGFTLIVSATALIAAPWYLRNFLYFRNPVFPKEVVFHGKIIFAGVLDASFFAPITLGFHFGRLFANWRQFMDGLGLALPILVAVPLVLVALFASRKRFGIRFEDLLWLVLLPALLLGVYMITPFSLLSRGVNSWEVQPRFLLPFAACLHVSTGFLFSRVKGATRLATPAIAVAVLANIAQWTHYWWLLGALAAVVAIAAVMAAAPMARGKATAPARPAAPWYVAPALVISFVAIAALSHWLDGFRERRKDIPDFGYRGQISPGWGAVSVYVRHNLSDQRILCMGRPEDFPLYGPGYTNTLYTADDSYAMDSIRENHIDYVVGFRDFVRLGAQGEDWRYLPAATEALRERYPAHFQLVYFADGAEVMKVVQ